MRIYPRGKRGTLWVDLTVDGERIKRSTGTTDKRAAQEYAACLARDLWRVNAEVSGPTGPRQPVRETDELPGRLRSARPTC